MIEIGVNIVEIVTKGLYTNPLDIFREYIQNSCDAIDDAVDAGILQENDGKIEITIDAKARRITIEDNGMGIPKRYFEKTMSKIGNSDKSLKTDRGFRGIGRLCGLAYCREARFISTAKGETKLSIMTIDAERLRKEFFSDNKHSAEYVLRDVIKFNEDTIDVDEHFFKVELIDIVETNSALLKVDLKEDDDPSKIITVRDYLSFVAPVMYNPNFYYESLIKAHAAELNFKITEYKILVNGEPLDKPYKTNVQTRMGKDEIFGVDFRDFKDEEGNLIAWSWIGLSNFKGVLDQTKGTPDNRMRGIRLRAGNIQIGDADVFKKFFSEARGTTYFIGEVHTVDTNLTPNSRRDYFEENAALNFLEKELEKYFVELYEMYHAASDIRGFYKKINAPDEAKRDFQAGRSKFKKRTELDEELVKLKKAAASAENKISSMRQEAEQTPDSALSRVILRMTENNLKYPPPIHILYRRINKNNSRRFIGRVKGKSFTSRLRQSYSTTRSLRATNSSTSWKRSLPNEPPCPADRAELQEQIHSRELDETRNLLSAMRRRRAILQGRFENFCRAAVA